MGIMNVIGCMHRDVLPSRYAAYVPIPSAFGLPFYLGPNYAVTMGLGSLIKLVWEKTNPAGAEKFVVPGMSCSFQTVNVHSQG
jgi:hypothetical protein